MTTNSKQLRPLVESKLMQLCAHVQPFTPADAARIEPYKDGSFGTSALSFALYSNGHNLRGTSEKHRYGLIYEDGTALFSIGYFTRELDPSDQPGFVTIISPREKGYAGNAMQVVDLTQRILASDIPCQGVYARFLTLDQYRTLLQRGFLPVEEAPWHPDAPKEDETYLNSIVDLQAGSSEMRSATNRFSNFLRRNKLNYRIESIKSTHCGAARQILEHHFDMLARLGKQIGSTPQDHYNSLDPALLEVKGISGIIGFLGKEPASFFIGEALSKKRWASYSGYALREIEQFTQIPIKDITGFTALPLYAYNCLFEYLRAQGFTQMHLGGSELPSLNKFKRKSLKARPEPSYWVVKMKQ